MNGTGYPLHSPVSPSLTLPYVTVCNHIATILYLLHIEKSEKHVYRGWSQVLFVKGGVVTGHVKKVYRCEGGVRTFHSFLISEYKDIGKMLITHSARFTFLPIKEELYRMILSLETPNYCLCIQSNSAGFSFVNTGKQVHLKHARRHFERNSVKDVHHRSVASRNWLKS